MSCRLMRKLHNRCPASVGWIPPNAVALSKRSRSQVVGKPAVEMRNGNGDFGIWLSDTWRRAITVDQGEIRVRHFMWSSFGCTHMTHCNGAPIAAGIETEIWSVLDVVEIAGRMASD